MAGTAIQMQEGRLSQKSPSRIKTADQYSGLYYVLNSYFYQNSTEITESYAKLKEFFSSEELRKKKPEEVKSMLARIDLAYHVLSDENNKKKYMNQLRLRSYLNQIIDSDDLLHYPEVKLFPFFIFEVFKENCPDTVIIEYDFIHMEMRESGSKQGKCVYKFEEIEGTVFSVKEDEYVVNMKLQSRTHSFNYRVKFITQRNQIVEITQIAKAVSEENKPFLKFINPIFKDVYNNSLDIFKIPELKSQFKNKFYWNDNIMPQKSLAKFEVHKMNRFSSTKVFIFVGVTQIVIAADPEAEKILEVYPIKQQYIAFVSNRQSIHFYVLNKSQKYKFHNDNEAHKFNAIILKSYEMRKGSTCARTIMPINTEFMMEASYLRPFRTKLILKMRAKIAAVAEKQKKYSRKLNDLLEENDQEEAMQRLAKEKLSYLQN